MLSSKTPASTNGPVRTLVAEFLVVGFNRKRLAELLGVEE